MAVHVLRACYAEVLPLLEALGVRDDDLQPGSKLLELKDVYLCRRHVIMCAAQLDLSSIGAKELVGGSSSQPLPRQRAVVQEAIRYLVMTAGKQPDVGRHLLSCAYRISAHAGMTTLFSPNITAISLNTLPDELCLPPWRALLPLLGKERMHALLTAPSLAIFKGLPNACMMQLTGVPLGEEVRALQARRPSKLAAAAALPSREVHLTGLPMGKGGGTQLTSKPPGQDSDEVVHLPACRSLHKLAGSWTLPRQNMLYVTSYASKHAGFPRPHALSKQSMATIGCAPGTAVDPQSARLFIHRVLVHSSHVTAVLRAQTADWVRDMVAAAANDVAAIARQQGAGAGAASSKTLANTESLASAWDAQPEAPRRDSKGGQGHNGATPGAVTAQGKQRMYACQLKDVPAHLEQAVPVFQALLQRAMQVCIGPSLRRHCPDPGFLSPVGAGPCAHAVDTDMSAGDAHDKRKSKRKRAEEHEEASEGASRHVSTAAPVPLSSTGSLPVLESACTHAQVSAFLTDVLESLLPEQLWGGARNKSKILSAVSRWVGMGRNESMQVQELMQGLRTADFHCFFPIPEPLPPASASVRVLNGVQVWNGAAVGTEAARAAQQDSVTTWIVWLFTDVVSSLLRAHFYITDGQITHNALLYYRKGAWARLSVAALRQLRERMQLRPVSVSQTITMLDRPERGRIGFATLRLNPKEGALRPITNCKVPRVAVPRYRTEEESAARKGARAAHKNASSVTQPLPKRSRLDVPAPDLQPMTLEASAQASLRRLADMQPRAKSINAVLLPVHEALKYEHKRDPSLAGASVFGMDGIHTALRRFAAARMDARERTRVRREGDGGGAGPVLSSFPASVSSSVAAQAGPSPWTPDMLAIPAPHGDRPAGPSPDTAGAQATAAGLLHVFTADVTSAYDSIPQDKALASATDALSHEGYAFRTYAVVCVVPGVRIGDKPGGLTLEDIKVKNLKLTHPSNEWLPFQDFSATSASGGCRNLVFVDAPDKTYIKRRDELRDLLAIHVKEHLLYVKDGGGMFLQACGIPQGSILSSMLCNLFLGSVERKNILPRAATLMEAKVKLGQTALSMSAPPQSLPQSGPVLLMRHTDDWMVISEGRGGAEALAAVIHTPDPSTGVIIKATKTESSFPLPIPSCSVSNDGAPASLSHIVTEVQPVVDPETGHPVVTWCGLRMDACTGEVRADNSRYMGPGCLRMAVRVAFTPSPACAIGRMLRNFLRPKCHPVLLDGHLNRVSTVALNVCEIALVAGAKIAIALRELRPGTRGSGRRGTTRGTGAAINVRGMRSPSVLTRLCVDAAGYLVALIRTRCPGRAREGSALPPTLLPRGTGLEHIRGPSSATLQAGLAQARMATPASTPSEYGSAPAPAGVSIPTNRPPLVLIGPYVSAPFTPSGLVRGSTAGPDVASYRRRLRAGIRAAKKGVEGGSDVVGEEEEEEEWGEEEARSRRGRPVAWCPLTRTEIQWLTLTAFARVFARLHGTFPDMPTLLLEARDKLIAPASTDLSVTGDTSGHSSTGTGAVSGASTVQLGTSASSSMAAQVPSQPHAAGSFGTIGAEGSVAVQRRVPFIRYDVRDAAAPRKPGIDLLGQLCLR